VEITKLQKRDLLILKGKIKGLAEEGSRCRKFIHASSKEKRSRHWDVKRSIGVEARYHLIAYGLLRGIEYDKIEPNSNKEIIKHCFDFNYLASIVQRHCRYVIERGIWTPDNLKRLIVTGTMRVTVTVVERVLL